MRSLMVFGLLAIVVFFGFQYFVKPKPTPPAQNQTQQATPRSRSPRLRRQTLPRRLPKAKAPSAAAAAVAASETLTTVENADYRITFTNRGAQVQHWVLKHYFDSTGKPLDMVQVQAAERFGFPLSLFTYDQNLSAELNQALYQASVTGNVTAPAGIQFHYARNGVDVVKTFLFGSGLRDRRRMCKVKRDGQPVRALLQWPAGLGDMEEFVASTRGRAVANIGRTPSQFVWSLAGKEDTETAGKVSNNNTLEGSYDYAATADLYFAAAFLPEVPERATVVTLHHAIDLPTDPSNPNSEKKPADVLGLAMGDTSGDTRLRLYAGPEADGHHRRHPRQRPGRQARLVLRSNR